MTKPPPFTLSRAFAGQEKTLVSQLRTGKDSAGHAGTQGTGTEQHWHQLLADRLPNRYWVTPAFVVDSKGEQSEQIDLAIVDRHFSPLWWEWGGHLYVPAESVYAAFEVKSKINKGYLAYAGKKVAAVRRLHRTNVAFGWAQGVMKKIELPAIIGGFLAGESEWTSGLGQPFRNAMAALPKNDQLDLGCVLGCGSFEIPKGAKADGVVVHDKDLALVSFMMLLLKRLQSMGSAPAIDYDAYSEWMLAQTRRS